MNVCLMHGLSACTTTPFARVTLQPSGNRVLLCKSCLDIWLDGADDEEWLEPAGIELLQGVAA